MPEHASQLYARNVQALLELFVGRRTGAPARSTSRTRSSPARASRATARSSTRAPRPRPASPRSLTCSSPNLAILVLAGFVGYAVISKVPNTLHTPLMSGTNAIHGIVVLGGILVLGLGADGVAQQAAARHRDRLRHDQRRRRLPGHRPDARDVQGQAEAPPRRRSASVAPPLASFLQDADFIDGPLHRRLHACSSTGCAG